MTRFLAISLALATGCGDKKAEPTATTTGEAERKAAEQAEIDRINSAPPPPRPPAKPSRFQADVDLTFTGAIEKKLTGPIGVCGATFIDGRIQGGNYGVRTDELDFQVIAVTDKELTAPKALLNISKPTRMNFVGRRGKTNVAIDVAKGATIDLELKNLMGEETIKVTGTVTCGPDYRAK